MFNIDRDRPPSELFLASARALLTAQGYKPMEHDIAYEPVPGEDDVIVTSHASFIGYNDRQVHFVTLVEASGGAQDGNRDLHIVSEFGDDIKAEPLDEFLAVIGDRKVDAFFAAQRPEKPVSQHAAPQAVRI